MELECAATHRMPVTCMIGILPPRRLPIAASLGPHPMLDFSRRCSAAGTHIHEKIIHLFDANLVHGNVCKPRAPNAATALLHRCAFASNALRILCASQANRSQEGDFNV